MSRPHVPAYVLLVLSITWSALGCGHAQSPSEMAASRGPHAGSDAAPTDPSEHAGVAVAATDRSADRERKVIYTADLSVVVDDFSGAAARLGTLVEQHGGYIAHTDLQTASGRPRSGKWTVRVPVTTYGAFLDAAASLGELQSRREDSQEVTEQYYDLDARIRNKQREEERLLELLQTQTGKLQDVLEVERELSRVREEVERFQGTLRVLQDKTALSTVNLRIHELRGYVPDEAPRFATRIARTWSASLKALLDTGQEAVVTAVALLPWLIATMPVWLGLTLVIRRRLRNGRR